MPCCQWPSRESYKGSQRLHLKDFSHGTKGRGFIHCLPSPIFLKIAPLGVYFLTLLVAQLWMLSGLLETSIPYKSQRNLWKEGIIQQLISEDSHQQQEVGQHLYSSVHCGLAEIRGIPESCINLDK